MNRGQISTDPFLVFLNEEAIQEGAEMPRTSLQEFIDLIHGRFPNLKRYDETRLFTVLMQSGINVEFDFRPDGTTMVTYEEIGPEAEKKLSQQ